MIKRLLCMTFVLLFAAAFTGCAENEHKMTTKKESKTESEPQDKSPGTMVVE
jgi:hypothetical protein